MATTISSVNNQESIPVVYVGKHDAGPVAPTGWMAYAFAPRSNQGFGWQVTETQNDQCLFTSAGAFVIWDFNWDIWCQQVGQSNSFVLVHVNQNIGGINIEITVGPDGRPSARQV